MSSTNVVPPWRHNGFSNHTAVLRINHFTLTNVHPNVADASSVTAEEDEVTLLDVFS